MPELNCFGFEIIIAIMAKIKIVSSASIRLVFLIFFGINDNFVLVIEKYMLK